MSEMGESARGGMPVLYVVIPCFNEEDALPITADVLWKLMGRLVSEGHVAAGSRVLLVDDGSKDRTWEAIRALHDDPSYGDLFCGISLAHNRGHQAALLAGLMTAYEWGCDCAVSMDADLQDDPEVIADMLAEYEAGAEVVFGVRSSRETDTLFKRCTASAFYRLFNALGAEAVPDSADFRLMGRRSLSALLDYPEANLFLRGLVAQLGFETAQVRYRRAARTAGESKYPLRKMVAFAADGITSFSVVPLRLIVAAGMGFVSSCCGNACLRACVPRGGAHRLGVVEPDDIPLVYRWGNHGVAWCRGGICWQNLPRVQAPSSLGGGRRVAMRCLGTVGIRLA